MIAATLTSTRFALLRFRRNPASTFFTVIFPMIVLVLFGFAFGGEQLDSGAAMATVQVPGILTLSLVSATFVNLAMNTVIRRESGQLKRLRGTPLPPLVYIAGQVLASFVIVLFMTLLVTVVGTLLFDVTFAWGSIGVFVITVLLGTMTFCSLGLAITGFIPNQDAAPAITNAAVFPLYFISDVFFASDSTPKLLQRIADIFPLKPLTASFQTSFTPGADLDTIPWARWAMLVAWGVGGVAVAARTFRWTSQADR